jgi:hypothetical protein
MAGGEMAGRFHFKTRRNIAAEICGGLAATCEDAALDTLFQARDETGNFGKPRGLTFHR